MAKEIDPSLSTWPEHLNGDLLVPVSGEEEFSKYLDFDFNFAEMDEVANQPHNAVNTSSSPAVSTAMQDIQPPRMAAPHQQHMQGISQAPNYQPALHQLHHTMGVQGINTTNGHVEPQYYVQKQVNFLPQNYGQVPYIPPTPNSAEMHVGVPNVLARLDTGNRRHYEHYPRAADDQSAFTPLLSPAMTPLDQQFRLPEYTVPGEYFTPLTSPALEAGNANSNNYIFNGTTSQGPDLGFVSSPIDATNHLPSSSAPSSPVFSRKPRRKQSFPTRAAARFFRQSPSVRPLSRRKTYSNSAVPSEESFYPANHEKSSSRLPANPMDGYRHPGSTESSGQDSVSPEPLSEPLMPPPALPRSVKSPGLGAQESISEAIAREAATPATLMKLQSQPQPVQNSGAHFSRSGGVVNEYPDEMMEDILLPEAASSNSELATASSGTIVTNPEPTPTFSANQTPKLKPMNSGSSDLPAVSSVPSPQVGAMPSPTGPVGIKRVDSKLNGRISKKRPSISSSQVSPALRPKISPSIQPLIRGDVLNMTPETSALYLASKSNYQHIIEGTLLPGVSYPNALAENLSSKRTNHKLAEQGRRNRINTALKEIEGLLPPALIREREKADKAGGSGGDGDGASGGTTTSTKTPEKSNSTQSISKASTVELAIVYIKSLQQELSETKEKLKLTESRLLEYTGNDEKAKESEKPKEKVEEG
ncbi:uncharacterized protein PADG_07720 [Paracoccidioides brasiliensis Pb18]|uniref:BHLH domain-containing protein n=2 Tax=Paracoccidioides brasiliensis TaxID=121759 RepID=C1GKD4_PARBD|nr:uncharacterized protein PADG_07720 [Paracoccidioides brasiliensis Pb18]EEH42900.1 hypothetical protein PADG_07720 [Paracoccidioides brasiliensis Pb18]ODH12656.1 hypothetical protein ACO22_08047 [Paracoccidioides brasiliensis]